MEEIPYYYWSLLWNHFKEISRVEVAVSLQVVWLCCKSILLQMLPGPVYRELYCAKRLPGGGEDNCDKTTKNAIQWKTHWKATPSIMNGNIWKLTWASDVCSCVSPPKRKFLLSSPTNQVSTCTEFLGWKKKASSEKSIFLMLICFHFFSIEGERVESGIHTYMGS